MRRVLMTALAAAAISSAAPAFAAATLVDQTGPDLAVRIYAAQDGAAKGPAATVFGNAGPANELGHNTSFTGYSTNDVSLIQANPALNTTNITIDNSGSGGGFAQVNDADYSNNPQNLANNNLWAVVMDITTFDFTKYEFSIQLDNTLRNGATSSGIEVYYMLAGGNTWLPTNPATLPTANQDNQFILTADANTAFTKVLITSFGASIAQIKQNSVQPLPEPGTWAMMLLGFGGIGMAMRRRRRSQALMQIA